MNYRAIIFSLLCLLCGRMAFSEDGYRLWLRYDLVDDSALLHRYRALIPSWQLAGNSPTLSAARKELETGLGGLLGVLPGEIRTGVIPSDGSLIAGTPQSSPFIKSLHLDQNLNDAGTEGFVLLSLLHEGRHYTVIAANTDIGILYGVFQFLRLLQTHQEIGRLDIGSAPANRYRILDHWDNLNGTIERGYAGISLWNWHTLPLYIDQRYIDYARADASIGINGSVINSINANVVMLTHDYLLKAAALAATCRPYGIKVYLSVRFSAPVEMGGLKTADPMDPQVQAWWKQKVEEIYSLIPDFGGFLVKANSEGQPGPQNYGRTHADGANMLATALAPHGGIVMWRAFVYNPTSEDRAKQAYEEFKPLDGKFRDNVLIQVKNGPIDFQPREPFSPLFGAVPHTTLMMEFQLTQEYLGFATHLVYLAPLFAECLLSDTYAHGQGSPVYGAITGMAAVANTGNDRNWCGHPFAQANWYAYGRMAWTYGMGRKNPPSPGEIADEWIRQTFTNNPLFIDTVKKIMLASRENTVDYMTPLGLNTIMAEHHHYGPGPWVDKASRADWNSTYYHRADKEGLGFDRTATGSNALEQYAPEVRKIWEDPATCPAIWLLWFHHLPWNFKMASGRTLWGELCYTYYAGVDAVRGMQQSWNRMRPYIDPERWDQVRMLMEIQENEAVWWRNACLLYFQTFSGLPIPPGYEQPDHPLAYYESLKFPYAPGTGR